MRMNAVAFSNLPQHLFERELKPKLEKVGVSILRRYTPDQDIDTADCDGVDAVIAFIDLMSHGQFDAIRRMAKKRDKPVVGLERQASNWPDALRPLLPRLSLEAHSGDAMDNSVGPPSVPPQVKHVMNTFMSLTKSGIDEDELLIAMNAVCGSRVASLDVLEDSFDRYVKTASTTPEFSRWWTQHKKEKISPPPPPSQRLMLTPRQVPVTLRELAGMNAENMEDVVKQQEETEIEALQRQLKETQEMETAYAEDNKSLAEQVQELRRFSDVLQGERTQLSIRLKETSDQLAGARAASTKYKTERDTLRTERANGVSSYEITANKLRLECQRLEARVDMLTRELEAAQNPNNAGSLDKLGASLKNLIAMGLMSREEASEKLAKHLLDER